MVFPKMWVTKKRTHDGFGDFAVLLKLYVMDGGDVLPCKNNNLVSSPNLLRIVASMIPIARDL
jgi:hypothetical protein